jgi:hypothetical protein
MAAHAADQQALAAAVPADEAKSSEYAAEGGNVAKPFIAALAKHRHVDRDQDPPSV